MEIYEAPEIIELGDAEDLTLASPSGSPEDCCGACIKSGGGDDIILA